MFGGRRQTDMPQMFHSIEPLPAKTYAMWDD